MLYICNVSTLLTALRIILTPIIVHTIYQAYWMTTIVLFALATSTDFFDGYYARRYNQETEFGKAFDPVADKILIFGTLFALYQTIGKSLIPSWFVYLLLSKDLILMIGGLCLLGQNYKILHPSRLSKWTTALLMIFMIYLVGVQCDLISLIFIQPALAFFSISTCIILLDYALQIYRLPKE